MAEADVFCTWKMHISLLQHDVICFIIIISIVVIVTIVISIIIIMLIIIIMRHAGNSKNVCMLIATYCACMAVMLWYCDAVMLWYCDAVMLQQL